MSKAYSKLIEHLIGRVQRMMLDRPSLSKDDIDVFRFHKEMLEATKKALLDKNHLGKAKALEKEHVAQKKSSIKVLYPELEEAIRDSIAAWNKSSSKKEDLERFVAIYDDAKVEKKRKGPRIAPADYQHCVNFTVFTVSLLNSNRKSVLPAVTNGDWRKAKDVYQEVEGGELVAEATVFSLEKW